jgi:hypothetical protein
VDAGIVWVSSQKDRLGVLASVTEQLAGGRIAAPILQIPRAPVRHFQNNWLFSVPGKKSF